MNPAKPSKFRCFSQIFSKIWSKFGVFEAVIEHNQSKISSSPGNAKHNIERSAAKICGIISKSLEQIWADTNVRAPRARQAGSEPSPRREDRTTCDGRAGVAC